MSLVQTRGEVAAADVNRIREGQKKMTQQKGVKAGEVYVIGVTERSCSKKGIVGKVGLMSKAS